MNWWCLIQISAWEFAWLSHAAVWVAEILERMGASWDRENLSWHSRTYMSTKADKRSKTWTLNQQISTDPICSRGSAWEEKLPAASVRSESNVAQYRPSTGPVQAVAQRLGPVPGGSFRPCCLTMAKALSFRALALREGPLTGAVQDESQLQEDASKSEAGSAGRQANWRFEGSF